MKNNNQGSKSPISLYFFIILAIVIAVFLFKKISDDNKLTQYKNKIIPEAVKKVINNSATKFSVESVKNVNGVYEFVLKVGEGANSQNYTSYISSDGKILFTSGIKLDTLNNNPQTNTTNTPTKKLTCNDVTKADNPNLIAFVVANCPYGLQMQRVIKVAINDLPSLANNLAVKYLGSIDNGKITSMHGDQEAQENLRQICIREEQAVKYWGYVGCYMQEGKSDACLTSTNIDTTQLKSCTDDKNRGLKYAQADFDLANKNNVGGSPTLIVNNTQTISESDFGGRVPDALRQIICCASKIKPDFCSKEISKDAVAASFSTTDVAGATASASSSCGTQ